MLNRICLLNKRSIVAHTQAFRSMSDSRQHHGSDHHHYLQVTAAGHSRKVVLDRPKALNSLNLEMCTHMKHLLSEWFDPANRVGLFVMKGAGEKAFCAGEISRQYLSMVL